MQKNTEMLSSIDEDLAKAAQLIRDGGLVAFPTETVYGLGANALDPKAVSEIFNAKGRPADNPLIVHISDVSQVYNLSDEVTIPAERVMEAFWPGPLTVVLPRKPGVPDVVTSGLDTVAVRMPDHPVALGIISRAGVPVAAPSANSSGKPSPTTAGHVAEDLSGKIDAVVDGGPCRVGVESTVIDLTQEPPVILRPGGVTQEELEGVLGHVETAASFAEDYVGAPRSPGMKYRHYSPKAEVVLVIGEHADEITQKVSELLAKYHCQGKITGVLAAAETAAKYSSDAVFNLGSRECPEEIARSLFYGLRYLDMQGVDIIISEGYSEKGIGAAVMNRLKKAAGSIIFL
ncbi:L-threonylcarbamoyladenylate synthase [Phosphitispora sp. TUW77]|uniref:L-threonylcarbamoyladenylate synthase n=1 Tax=Phosphitispora sp. TUW77 TaxID=3152361 RepID=UPI003AB6F501